ncbi:hypothetical protein KP509_13G093600 [Ceratopteris richardii]|uniref:VQ domain-containing protein n=1 Tax=Ceratopteris richardii TaxID=49495 RepID=A0A8T2TJY8_CERRI|nr:hypothetical protein KP509_13G093600 [Ceratopteris richardii]
MSRQLEGNAVRVQRAPIIRVLQVSPPQVVCIDVADFRSTVQKLTGWAKTESDTCRQSSSPSSCSSSSPMVSSCCNSPPANIDVTDSTNRNGYAGESLGTQTTHAADAICTNNLPESGPILSPTTVPSLPLSGAPSKLLKSAMIDTILHVHAPNTCPEIVSSSTSASTAPSSCSDLTVPSSAKGDEDLFLCMMTELEDIQHNKKQPFLLMDNDIITIDSHPYCPSLTFLEPDGDEESFLHFKLLANLQS